MLYTEITSGQWNVTAHFPSLRHVLEGLFGRHGPHTAWVRRWILAACLVALGLPGLMPAAATSFHSSSDGALSGMRLILAQVCNDVPLSLEGAFADAVTGLVMVRKSTDPDAVQRNKKREIWHPPPPPTRLFVL